MILLDEIEMHTQEEAMLSFRKVVTYWEKLYMGRQRAVTLPGDTTASGLFMSKAAIFPIANP